MALTDDAIACFCAACNIGDADRRFALCQDNCPTPSPPDAPEPNAVPSPT